MAVSVDVSAMEQAIDLLRLLRDVSAVSAERLGQYLATPGMSLLKRHLQRYGGIVLDEAFLADLFETVGSNPVLKPDDHVFLRSAKRGWQLLDTLEPQLRSVDFQALVERAVVMANEFLPEQLDEDITVYFLYGIRGTGIVLDKEIGIDVCDPTLFREGALDHHLLIGVLAHELHHIGVSKHVTTALASVTDCRLRMLGNILEPFLSEGAAYLYITPPEHLEEGLVRQWQSNLTNITAIFGRVNSFIDGIRQGTLSNLSETEQLFDNSLQGYTAGYIMIKAIEDTLGRKAVLDSIRSCLLFPRFYNSAVELGAHRLPQLDLRGFWETNLN